MFLTRGCILEPVRSVKIPEGYPDRLYQNLGVRGRVRGNQALAKAPQALPNFMHPKLGSCPSALPGDAHAAGAGSEEGLALSVNLPENTVDSVESVVSRYRPPPFQTGP